MQVTQNQKSALWKTVANNFPKGHVLLAVGLASGLAIVAALPSENASASRQSHKLTLPELKEAPLETLDAVASDKLVPTLAAAPDLQRVEETVRSGDSLSKIFARAGLDYAAMLELINSSDAAKQLAMLYPGRELIFQLNADGKLQTLEYIEDQLRSQIFSRTEDGFAHETKVLEPDVQLAMRQATITDSLFLAGMKVRLDDRMIMKLANIFGWDIDFALDIRKGDSFKVLFEEAFLNGEKIGNGNILAAEFTNQGRTFRAVRYVDSNGDVHYYTPTGESMRKAFLRAPLDFRRISSNFNPNRLHPIYKTVRPHRGTDYAAVRGTPVWAAGDGRVIESGYTRANGNYIVVQHGNSIQTKYLHLHKRDVKKGDRVRQQQRIGSVGSTGYSTAPHLHYEFLINGVHRNPRTVLEKLPKAESVAKAELQRFYAQTQPLLAELDQDENTRFARAGNLDSARTL
jgi:murein DD-endopeptidase MepM/ murein hydrolase activator NlpD